MTRDKTNIKDCPNCAGTGKELLMRSWFVSDGYRLSRCGDCSGSGEVALGYPAVGRADFNNTARARIAAWGGMKPAA